MKKNPTKINDISISNIPNNNYYLIKNPGNKILYQKNLKKMN